MGTLTTILVLITLAGTYCPQCRFWNSSMRANHMQAKSAPQTSAVPLTGDPKIVHQDGKWQLILSQSLLDAARSNFPDFRIPSPQDWTGTWATAASGKFPFITWGDFNGDVLTDVALVLLNENQWKVAVFHQQPDGTYTVGYQTGGATGSSPNASVRAAQDISLLRLLKGKEHKIEAGGQTFSYTFQTDAIEMNVNESGLYLMFWKDGKYEYLSFVD